MYLNPLKNNPRNSLSKRHTSQEGMALVAVIFLLVIMSGAVLMMSRLSDMQAAERTLEILGARGQMAAQSGLQWIIYRISAAPANCGDDTPITFALTEADLNGFLVSVTCEATTFIEGLDEITTYEVTSSASFQSFDGDAEYVYRQVTAVLEL